MPPGCCALYVGPNTAALLLIAAEITRAAAQRGGLAHLSAPPRSGRSSGKSTAQPLNPSRDPHHQPCPERIVARLQVLDPGQPPTPSAAPAEGKSKAEIVCLKHYVARDRYHYLRPPPANARSFRDGTGPLFSYRIRVRLL